MTPPRADAARNRDAILAAARAHPIDLLRLNEVARDAGVGVATVYRHFPTVGALVEALACDAARHLQALVAAAEAEPDAAVALTRFLEATVTMQLANGGLQGVLTAPDEALGEARGVKCEIMRGFARVLDRAKGAGAVCPELTVDQLHNLVCGIEHAVRLGSPDDLPLLLGVVLTGIGTRAPSTAAVPA